ncbi:MAG: hypothetical protein IPO36_20105 [Anaerolineales bacterium]|nr:hypothetical protein [Anaerolineales bacterium]
MKFLITNLQISFLMVGTLGGCQLPRSENSKSELAEKTNRKTSEKIAHEIAEKDASGKARLEAKKQPWQKNAQVKAENGLTSSC